MFSIVIPVRNIEKYEEKIKINLQDIKNVEVILAEGKNPSFQRNEAVKQASGDIIYFLDDDAQPNRKNLEIAENIFKEDEKIAVIGGPAVQTEFKNFWQKIFNGIFTCFFATGKSRARYKKTGKKRISDEKEVILCNLFVKKDIFLKSGGFLQELYPNEENEFLNRLKKYGYKIIYEPEISVERAQRENLFQFIIQCFRYGKGRAEQIFYEFTKGDLINFIPAFFVVYLLSLLFINNRLFFLPLVIYLILNIFYSFRQAYFIKNIFSFFVFFNCFFLLHFLYGAGFIVGVIFKLFKLKKKIISDIKIKKIKI